MDDTTRICLDCGQPFPWTAGEQQFYADKGFLPPKRCEKCRLLKRQRMQEHADRETARKCSRPGEPW